MEIASKRYFTITGNDKTEISEADIKNAALAGTVYAVVTLDDGNWCKTFFSRQGSISFVEYNHQLKLSQILAVNRKFFNGFGYRIYKPIAITEDQETYELWFFSNDGRLTSISINHETSNEWLKEALFDANKQFTGGQRFAYQDGDLLYGFEYDARGALFNCLDMKADQLVRFDDINDLDNKEIFRSFGEIMQPSELLP